MIGDVATCPMCGGKFAKKNGMQRYCSAECSLESERIRAHRYYERTKANRPKNQKKPRHTFRNNLDQEARQAVAALTVEQRMRLIGLLATDNDWARLRREGGWEE